MVNYQDIKTFLLLTLKNWNTDPSLIIDLSRYTNPLVFSRRLKTSIYTSGCKQRAKYVKATAVEFITKCMKLIHDRPKNKEWSDERCDISWFCLQTEVAGPPHNLSRYYEEGEQTCYPMGGAKKCGTTQQVRQKPQTHKQASQNYITTLVQQILKLFKRMCGSSQWIVIRRLDATVGGLKTPRPGCYWPGGRFIRKMIFVGLFKSC